MALANVVTRNSFRNVSFNVIRTVGRAVTGSRSFSLKNNSCSGHFFMNSKGLDSVLSGFDHVSVQHKNPNGGWQLCYTVPLASFKSPFSKPDESELSVLTRVLSASDAEFREQAMFSKNPGLAKKLSQYSNLLLLGAYSRPYYLKDIEVLKLMKLYLEVTKVVDDHAENTKDKQELDAYLSAAKLILLNESSRVPSSFLEKDELSALRYFSDRFYRYLGEKSVDFSNTSRFLDDTDELFEANRREVAKYIDKDPFFRDYELYTHFRRFSLGYNAAVALGDLLVYPQAPDEYQFSRKTDVKALDALAGECIQHLNDAASLFKEIKERLGERYCEFNFDESVFHMSEDIQKNLPINGVIVRSFLGRIPVVDALNQEVGEYKKALMNILNHISEQLPLDTLSEHQREIVINRVKWAGIANVDLSINSHFYNEEAVSKLKV